MSEAKFRPGDIVSHDPYSEYKVVDVDSEEGAIKIEGYNGWVFDEFYRLVFRPATREETEALRRVAKAAETLIDTIEQKSKDACRIYSGEGSVLFEHKDILAAIRAYRKKVAGE